VAIVEWLLAEAVADREQPLLALVPQQKAEHPDEAVQAGLSPAQVRGEDDLGVGIGTEREVLKLGAQLPVVVDLAVESDPQPLARIGHRLDAGVAEVDDAQAVVAEARELARVVGFDVCGRGVGPAMVLRRDHRFELGERGARPEHARDSTHRVRSPIPAR